MSGRFKFIIILFSLICLIIVGRLFELQILGRDFYINKKFKTEQIPAERGEILIGSKDNLYPLAINTTRYNVIASPIHIKDEVVNHWINKMSEINILDIEQKLPENNETIIFQENDENKKIKDIVARLSKKNDYYELIKKNITREKMKEIKSLDLPGIYFEPKTERYYPEKNLFSHITGFVGRDKNNILEGRYGVEEFFNNRLAGESGERIVNLTAGEGNFLASEIKKSSKDGQGIVLTLDNSAQLFTCSLLEDSIKKYRADTGSIIVIDPKTGSIISMCNQPSFDPNKYYEVEDYSVFRNDGVSLLFEPGSIFKPLTMAGALDSGVVTPETEFVDSGKVEVEDYTITNVKNRKFGRVTMTEVLESSINTGAIFAVKKLGKQNFRNYLKKFGFGSLTGVGLSGEEGGDISNLDKQSKTYFYTASYGHGISVTPLQIVSAFSAIANSGKLMRPRIVSALKDNNGNIKDIKSEVIRQVIKPSSATILSSMMVSVVNNGYGKKAAVEGYDVAGKTGTALIPKKEGRGYTEKVIHSFIGFAPASNPRFVALVTLRNPKNESFSDATAAPVFSQLAEFLLNYLNVAPKNN